MKIKKFCMHALSYIVFCEKRLLSEEWNHTLADFAVLSAWFRRKADERTDNPRSSALAERE